MSNATAEREINAYHQEIHDTLRRLKEEAPPYREMDYFFRIVGEHYGFEAIKKAAPSVVVLGTSVPEELIYAAGATPYWVLGGSPRTGAWANDATPRDTDPVSRSILGYLDNGLFDLAKDALILLPIVNDSGRKLAYLLKQAGKNVHPLDVPPVKDRWAAEKWQRQWELCCEALAAHTGTYPSGRAIRRASEMVSRCRAQLRRLLQRVDERQGMMTGACRMLLIHSYYCAPDLMEWGRRLAALTAECELAGYQKGGAAGRDVLLVGSPVYFPNYKVPFLLQDAGLNLRAHVDYSVQKLLEPPAPKGESGKSIPKLAQAFFRRDCSAAYARNDALFACVSRLIREQPVDGIVYQVLKGQIEYDFELERLEALFASLDLPVFRLETDYNAQDVEQLRIRTEAFMEMLTQRRYRKEARAV